MTMVMALLDENKNEIDWTTPGNAIYLVVARALKKVSEKYDGSVQCFEFDWERLKRVAADMIVEWLNNDEHNMILSTIFALDFINEHIGDGIKYVRFEW